MTTEPLTPDLSETTQPAGRAVVVPDKPALEGLEAKWAAAVEGRRHVRASTAPRRREQVYSIDTPPPDRLRVAARRARLLLHPHRPDRPLPADARQRGLLPDGLGRQRPAHRAPGAELLRRALRPVAAVRRRLHAAGEAGRRSSRSRSAGRTSSSCASGSSCRTRRSSSRCGARSGSRSTGSSTTRRSAPKSQTASQRAFLRNFARGEAYLAGVPDPVGRHLPDRGRAGRAGGPRVRRRLPPGRLPPAATATPVYIETTRPELIPAVVALIAHPDDERYQALFGKTVTSPVFGVEIPVYAHRARRARQGRRHRDVLHVRRPDRRDLVARAAAAGPHRHRPRRPAAPRDPGVARGRAGRCGVRRAGGEDHLQRPRGDGRGAARLRRPRRRAEADPADDELLREGRQAAGDRLHPPVVHQERRPGHRAARRAGRPRRRRSSGCRRT